MDVWCIVIERGTKEFILASSRIFRSYSAICSNTSLLARILTPPDYAWCKYAARWHDWWWKFNSGRLKFIVRTQSGWSEGHQNTLSVQCYHLRTELWLSVLHKLLQSGTVLEWSTWSSVQVNLEHIIIIIMLSKCSVELLFSDVVGNRAKKLLVATCVKAIIGLSLPHSACTWCMHMYVLSGEFVKTSHDKFTCESNECTSAVSEHGHKWLCNLPGSIPVNKYVKDENSSRAKKYQGSSSRKKV